MNTNEHPADRVHRFLKQNSGNKFHLKQIMERLEISNGVTKNAIKALFLRDMIDRKFDGRFFLYYIDNPGRE